MKEEAKNLREIIDALNVRNKEHSDRIQAYISSHSTNQSELKHLKGDRFHNSRHHENPLFVCLFALWDLNVDQHGEISCNSCLTIEGELEEIKAELEENRRKLISLKMQKDAACEGHVTPPALANGSHSPEKPVDKTKLRELKDSVDEIKVTSSFVE